MIRIDGTKFGSVDVEDDALIRIPRGLVGFPDDSDFVLLERGEDKVVAYLQSVRNPGLCFPVMDGSRFGDDYPKPDKDKLARRVGVDDADVAVLVVVAARGPEQLVANLLAPLIIDMKTRTGAQVALDPRDFSAAVNIDKGVQAPAMVASGA